MATAAAEEEGPKIDIGRVLALSFEIFGRNAFGYLLLAAVLGGVPAFLSQYSLLLAAEAGTADQAWWLVSKASVAEILLAMTATALLQAAIARTAIRRLGGRSGGLLENVAEALKLILPLIGLVILTSLATLFGLVMLIVPGIIFYVAMSVSVPVLVEERRGVLGSIERSVELTRGSRWLIFGLLLAFFVAYMLLGAALTAASLVLPLGTFFDTPVGFALLDAAAQTVMEAVFAVMLAALYVELRTVKEGATSSALAAVFD